jgi:hypothetical protein
MHGAIMFDDSFPVKMPTCDHTQELPGVERCANFDPDSSAAPPLLVAASRHAENAGAAGGSFSAMPRFITVFYQPRDLLLQMLRKLRAMSLPERKVGEPARSRRPAWSRVVLLAPVPQAKSPALKQALSWCRYAVVLWQCAPNATPGWFVDIGCSGCPARSCTQPWA